MRQFAYLSIYLSIYHSIQLTIYLPSYQSIYLFIYLSMSISFYLSVYLSLASLSNGGYDLYISIIYIHMYINLPVYLSFIYLPQSRLFKKGGNSLSSMYILVDPTICLSIHISVRTYIYICVSSNYASIYLSLYPTF